LPLAESTSGSVKPKVLSEEGFGAHTKLKKKWSTVEGGEHKSTKARTPKTKETKKVTLKGDDGTASL